MPAMSVRRMARSLGTIAVLVAILLLVERAGLFGSVTRDGEAIVIDKIFVSCDRPSSGDACVSDGDSFRLEGERYRISGIDAPEIGAPECPAERTKGFAARDELERLFNAGPFRFIPDARRERDQYGRYLGRVVRDGRDLGAAMIEAGHARRYQGRQASWC
ncbi:thermonuclease family protein [Sphingomicrobium sediminis]|uniref:Thermonuclease family protein n=1 Tax=Sphingomicrobium sediminis TaxID=2950949 RepID=A0A9X2ELS1_9SPHN|nr:thermonuclease family protein [Sphingomicrobium sediminis]MCM8557777.1 thermonuclease family protein [Sphingomicrobium sediminis]